MSLLITIILFCIFMRVLRKNAFPHKWVYRNPFDRKCSVCHRHEVEHCYTDFTGHEWIVFHEGDKNEHKKGVV